MEQSESTGSRCINKPQRGIEKLERRTSRRVQRYIIFSRFGLVDTVAVYSPAAEFETISLELDAGHTGGWSKLQGTQLRMVILLCGLVLSVAAEEAKKAESNAQPKDEKSKRGLELSLGDHGGFGGGFGDGHGFGGGGGHGFGGGGGGGGFGGGHEIISTDHVKAVTVTKHVPVPHPYPVEVTKHVPYPVKVPIKVPVDRPYPVHVPQPYPVEVTKHVPYTVEKPVPYPVKVPIKVPVKVPYPVKVPVKVPVEIAKPVPYPVKVPVVVKEPYPVVVKHEEHSFGGFDGGHDFGGGFGGDFGGFGHH